MKDDISVLTAADKETITIGDRITYAIKIFMTDKITDVDVMQTVDFSPFELKDYKVYKDEVLKDGRVLKRVDYEITIYKTGEFSIPKIDINYHKKDKSSGVVSTEVLKIQVKSVIPLDQKEVKDIRDIKDVFAIKSHVWPWVGLGLLLLCGGVALFLYLRKKAKVVVPIASAQIKSAEEIAFEEIARLEAEGLVEKGQIKVYYLRLSEIIKYYLERKYKIFAVEYTTTEIVASLKKLKDSMDFAEVMFVQKFLSDSDLVKFAKFIPDAEFCRKSMDEARKIVCSVLHH